MRQSSGNFLETDSKEMARKRRDKEGSAKSSMFGVPFSSVLSRYQLSLTEHTIKNSRKKEDGKRNEVRPSGVDR